MATVENFVRKVVVRGKGSGMEKAKDSGEEVKASTDDPIRKN
jgi:hypothetical protein